MGVKKFVAQGKHGKELDTMLDSADGVFTAGCGRASAGIRNQTAKKKRR